MAHGCGPMEMGGSHWREGKRDIDIHRQQQSLGSITIATCHLEGYGWIDPAVFGNGAWQKMAQCVGTAGDAHMTTPDPGKV